VLITVINSARTAVPDRISRWSGQGYQTFIVVDECHRAGSEYNSLVFGSPSNFALGLSATPERSDRGHERVYEAIGKVVYRYPLLQALADGTVADLVSLNLYVDFTSTEAALWSELSERLTNHLRRFVQQHPSLENADGNRLFAEISRLAATGDRAALGVIGLLAKRRDLLARCSGRRDAEDAIAAWLGKTGKRAIVFHESIAAAEEIYARFAVMSVDSAIDHSKMKPEARDQSMSRFRSDRAHVLVAVRSLDEGLDVPDAEVAVIAAGSRSERQRIQRLGRVLRRGDGETRAIGITILARGTPEEIIGYRDASLLGPKRVLHHRWPKVSIEEGLHSTSSYSVPASRVSDADKLTLVDADLDALATPEALRLAEQATPPKVTQKRPRAGQSRAAGRRPATQTPGRLVFHELSRWEPQIGAIVRRLGDATGSPVQFIYSDGCLLGSGVIVKWDDTVVVDNRRVRLVPKRPAGGDPKTNARAASADKSKTGPSRTFGRVSRLSLVASEVGLGTEAVARIRKAYSESMQSSVGQPKPDRLRAAAQSTGLSPEDFARFQLAEKHAQQAQPPSPESK